MRIDLNRTAANEITAEKKTNQVAASEHARAQQTSNEDKTTLSTDSVAVADLAAQALKSPEIRQEKVDALRHAIQDGTYKIDPAAIAEAMLKDESQ